MSYTFVFNFFVLVRIETYSLIYFVCDRCKLTAVWAEQFYLHRRKEAEGSVYSDT